MNILFLKSDILQLRSPEPEDLDLMYEMENDTSMWCVGNATLPYSRYTLRAYLEQSKQDIMSERQARFIIELSNGEKAGMIDLADYDPINSRAEVCIGILGKHREKGIASEALKLLCHYASTRLHLHQLYAYIPEWNTACRKLFAKAGFNEYTVIKDWQRTGNTYADVLLVQKIQISSNSMTK